MKRTNLSEAIGSAVDDVRQKLIEEAWFGRPVAAGEQRPISVQLGWFDKEQTTERTELDSGAREIER